MFDTQTEREALMKFAEATEASIKALQAALVAVQEEIKIIREIQLKQNETLLKFFSGMKDDLSKIPPF